MSLSLSLLSTLSPSLSPSPFFPSCFSHSSLTPDFPSPLSSPLLTSDFPSFSSSDISLSPLQAALSLYLYLSSSSDFQTPSVLRPEVPHVGDASKISLPENVKKGCRRRLEGPRQRGEMLLGQYETCKIGRPKLEIASSIFTKDFKENIMFFIYLKAPQEI